MRKYKIGDTVKIKANPSMIGWTWSMEYLKGSVQTIKGMLGTCLYLVPDKNGNGTWLISEEDIEGLAEKESSSKTMGKKVRCIDAERSPFVKGNVYEVVGRSTDNHGTYYNLSTHGGGWSVKRFEDVKEESKPEPKYPIITTHHGEKVVFNPPYTIVICELTWTGTGERLIGKAKCHPSDTYDKWEGYKIAHERMTKATPCTK